VLVVGGGPSGSAAAYWLARHGVDVLCVEKKHFPREKTCGDGLTPRSVRQLRDMGLEEALQGSHRYEGLRSVAFGRALEMRWPEHPDFPPYGYTVTRLELDHLVNEHAEKSGAVVWQGAEAVAPLLDREAGDHVAVPSRRAGGAVVLDKDRGTRTEVEADYVIVADGALSRFGRALGCVRDKSYPQGMAIRGYFRSPRHDDAYIESHLDIHDREGNVVPGYGWIFPLGDGRVNVGIGILSTADRWRGLNTTRLMEEFVGFAPRSWCISPQTACSEPTGGRLPMGFSIRPRSGADYLVVGDAVGAINPFNGEGIAYGWETGRLAAEAVWAALGCPDSASAGEALLGYERCLAERYATYFAIASAFVRLIENPRVMRVLVAGGMYTPPVMRGVLRIMANLNGSGRDRLGEAFYRRLVRLSDARDRRGGRTAPAGWPEAS
jgi:menaquinone-9 beta-reductase